SSSGVPVQTTPEPYDRGQRSPKLARAMLYQTQRLLRDMIDQKNFERLTPLAYQWAKSQEAYILKHGAPLAMHQVADARRVGVEDATRVRVLVVDRIPMPDDKELPDAARLAQIITDSSRAVAIGH